jgi:hypothetical protein
MPSHLLFLISLRCRPAKNETLNVVEVVELAIDIFNEEKVVFESESPEIISKIDRTQLIRIITNLVMPFNRFRSNKKGKPYL